MSVPVSSFSCIKSRKWDDTATEGKKWPDQGPRRALNASHHYKLYCSFQKCFTGNLGRQKQAERS